MYSEATTFQPVYPGRYYKPFLEEVGDYLMRVASAVVSLIKRILCIPDPTTPQDIVWTAQRYHQMERKNEHLRWKIDHLKSDVKDLRAMTTWSPWEVLSIEITLFLIFTPLYLIALPVIWLRDAMYYGTKNNRISK